MASRSRVSGDGAATAAQPDEPASVARVSARLLARLYPQEPGGESVFNRPMERGGALHNVLKECFDNLQARRLPRRSRGARGGVLAAPSLPGPRDMARGCPLDCGVGGGLPRLRLRRAVADPSARSRMGLRLHARGVSVLRPHRAGGSRRPTGGWAGADHRVQERQAGHLRSRADRRAPSLRRQRPPLRRADGHGLDRFSAHER